MRRKLRALNYLLCFLLWAVLCVECYGGETYSVAKAVNDFGVIVGTRYVWDYQAPPVLRATLWFRDLTVFDLGTLPGGTSSEALGINNRGQVVGFSTTRDGSTHAFLWHWGRMHDLGTLGSDYLYSRANGINDRGEVVGVSCKQDKPIAGPPPWEYSNVDEPSCRAFLWRHGEMHDLGVYPGGTFSAAQAINNKGQIVGSGDVVVTDPEAENWWYTTRALLWNDGTPIAVTGVSGSCQCSSYASGINEHGVVIGWVFVPYINTYGFSWIAGNQTDFASYESAGEPAAYPAGINNRGQIVGWRGGANVLGMDTPFEYQNGKLVRLPIGELNPNDRISTAMAINESGLIVGSVQAKAAMWEHGAFKLLKQ